MGWRERRKARRVRNSQWKAREGRIALITPGMPEQKIKCAGRVYHVRSIGDWTFRVNNRIVQARWGNGHGYASGEVLERAMRLAIAAYPQTMADFDCGTRLEPGCP